VIYKLFRSSELGHGLDCGAQGVAGRRHGLIAAGAHAQPPQPSCVLPVSVRVAEIEINAVTLTFRTAWTCKRIRHTCWLHATARSPRRSVLRGSRPP